MSTKLYPRITKFERRLQSGEADLSVFDLVEGNASKPQCKEITK